MGNHEYCSECGESDFHYNQPCDPETKRKHKLNENITEEKYQKALTKALEICEQLVRMGYAAKINSLGDVVISKWSL